MENCGFQSQLLSVMEVLAKAAVAEINRRVDDSCAVLRLEVSRSRRDIELLKSKCEAMEAELRRSRMRARRKVFYPPAGERFAPSVKLVAHKQRACAAWDRQVDAEAHNQPQQCADVEPANEAERVQIKEERAEEEDVWKNDPQDKPIPGTEQPPCFKASQPAQSENVVDRYHSAENPADRESLISPTDGYGAFQERHVNAKHNGPDLIVKHEKEEEPDENAAPFDSGREFVTEEADGRLWSSNLRGGAGDPSFSYAGGPFEQIPTVRAPQRPEDTAPRIHPVVKSHSVAVNAARAKRRARTFGCRRAQAEEGHGALCQINSTDQSSIPQHPQHQHRDFAPPARDPDEDPTASSSSSSLCGHGRGGFGLARRMRAPWRSGVGEKRFSCTYCDKSFVRFSQLKEHLRSHTGEKPFSCLQCGRSFTKQCNLIRHAVVHSGEKPHECSLCGKCFTQRSSLKSHQKTAH